MRIALLVSSLGCGGAERASSRLAGEWSAAGHEVTVVTLAGESEDFFPLHQGIGRVALDLTGESGSLLAGLAANWSRLRALRRALAEIAPDIVVSFILEMNVLAVHAAHPLRIPVVACERSDPRRDPFRRGWRYLGRRAYRRAGMVVANSREVAAWMRGWLGREDVVSIPNSVVVPPNGAVAAPPFTLPSGPFVLGLGRLDRRKGFDILLEAFAACRRPKGWSLLLVGEGSERPALHAQAQNLGLQGMFQMPGTVPDPWPVLRAASIFALPSRLEGFPNALLEAMAAGLPCIASDCGSGSAELIESGRNGILVRSEHIPCLTVALQELIGDSERRTSMGAAAREVATLFSPGLVSGQWEEVFRKAREGSHG